MEHREEYNVNAAADLMMAGDVLQRDFAAFVGNIHALAVQNRESEQVDAILGLMETLKDKKKRAPGESFIASSLKRLKGILDPQPEAASPSYGEIQSSIREVTAMLNQRKIELAVNGSLYEELLRMTEEYINALDEYIAKCQGCLEQMPPPSEEVGLLNVPLHSLDMAKVEGERAALVRKLSDMRITRHVAQQCEAKIRLLLHNQVAIGAQLNTLLNHTIPLWNLSAGIAAGITAQKQTLRNQRAINDITRQGIEKATGIMEEAIATAGEEAPDPVAIDSFLHHIDELSAPLEAASKGAIQQNQSIIEELGNALEEMDRQTAHIGRENDGR